VTCRKILGVERKLILSMLYLSFCAGVAVVCLVLPFVPGYGDMTAKALGKGKLKDFLAMVAFPALGALVAAGGLYAVARDLTRRRPVRRVVVVGSPNNHSPSSTVATPKARRRAHGFAIPPFLHYFSLFMTQFTLTLFLVIPVYLLYERGVNLFLLAVGAIGALVAIYFLTAAFGRLVPVRCKYCRWPSRYRGLGWWPFTYRYACTHCKQEMCFEIKE
jgi:hypothetical protein